MGASCSLPTRRVEPDAPPDAAGDDDSNIDASVTTAGGGAAAPEAAPPPAGPPASAPASGLADRFTATTGLDSQDAWQAAKLAVRTGTDAILEAATKTPVVGGIVQLLINAKEKYGELARAYAETAEETEQFMQWCNDLLVPLLALFSSDGGRSHNDDATLAGVVEALRGAVEDMVAMAQRVLDNPSKHLKAVLWKDELQEKKDAVQAAMDNLQLALTVDTNRKVTTVQASVNSVQQSVTAVQDSVNSGFE